LLHIGLHRIYESEWGLGYSGFGLCVGISSGLMIGYVCAVIWNQCLTEIEKTDNTNP